MVANVDWSMIPRVMSRNQRLKLPVETRDTQVPSADETNTGLKQKRQAPHIKAQENPGCIEEAIRKFYHADRHHSPMVGCYTSRTSIGIHNTYIMCCRRHALVGALPFQILHTSSHKRQRRIITRPAAAGAKITGPRL